MNNSKTPLTCCKIPGAPPQSPRVSQDSHTPSIEAFEDTRTRESAHREGCAVLLRVLLLLKEAESYLGL
jgi:hypothetical protein